MKRKILILGLGLILVSLTIFGSIFYPIIFAEVKYNLKNKTAPSVNTGQFKIIIPKIGIEAKVFPGVNPYNKEEYLKALSQGVAQAKGSSLPGEFGNIFIFAHSTDSPLNITQYNAVFYLLNKLQTNDDIFLIYQGKRYKYMVTEIKIVEPSQVEYLQDKSKNKSLTLMTCWPPGTTLKRLLVQGILQDSY